MAYLVILRLLSKLVYVEPRSRQALTRERILRAAVDVADREGISALTMRRLGAELGVEAMSLYKHVANKDAILDGVVELIGGEIETPSDATDWKDAMRRRAVSARAVFASHSWAIGLLEARGSMGPATMRSLDVMLGVLRSGGFAIDDAAHAIWMLDSFVYGHVIQEASLAAQSAARLPAGEDHPNLEALLVRARASEFSVDAEFDYGLERILAALELPRRRARLTP